MNAARPKFDSWRHWYRLLPAYWISLFCVTHFPKLSIPGNMPQSDKLAHGSAYGLLAFLYWRFVQAMGRTPGRAFVWVTLIVLAAYGAADEITQPWFGRDCEFADWMTDMTGVGAVLASLEWLRRRSAAAKRSATSGSSSASRV